MNEGKVSDVLEPVGNAEVLKFGGVGNLEIHSTAIDELIP